MVVLICVMIETRNCCLEVEGEQHGTFLGHISFRLYSTKVLQLGRDKRGVSPWTSPQSPVIFRTIENAVIILYCTVQKNS